LPVRDCDKKLRDMRIGIAATSCRQYNGYARVAFELSKRLHARGHQVHYFAFQAYFPVEQRGSERDTSFLASETDAHALEKDLPEAQRTGGFGDHLIRNWVVDKKLDVVVVYNDLMVLSRLLGKIDEGGRPSGTKLVAYVDLVYRYENEALLSFIREHTDACIAFTDHWAEELRANGFKRVFTAEHGFSSDVYRPIPKDLARAYLGLGACDDFLVVQLNRNQPRKRLDVCLEGFVLFIKTLTREPKRVRMILGCEVSRRRGAWDVLAVVRAYCRKHGVDAEDMSKRIVTLNNAHKRSDRDINALYNAADVGVNTAEGEGFGLCTFEGAGLGVPQIASAVGGMNDFLTKSTAVMLQPKWSYYVTRDAVGGEAQVCAPADVADALKHMYENRENLPSFGRRAQAKVLEYTWDRATDRFEKALLEIAAPAPAAPEATGAQQIEGARIEITGDTGPLAPRPPAGDPPAAAGDEEAAALQRQLEDLQKQIAALAARVSSTK